MSTALQLSFFSKAQDDLHRALDIFRESGVEHLFFQRFVRRLAVAVKTAKPGTCIVAACPGGQTLDEAVAKLAEQVCAFASPHRDSPYVFRPIEVSVPTRFTARQLEIELLDRYTHALNSVQISHRGQPRFDDPNLANYNARTAISRLTVFLNTKSPDLIIIRDAQNIETPNASRAETRAGWRLIMDIARQSGVPHIIFAPAITVSEVIYGDPAMLSEVETVVFKPYHNGAGGEMNSFLGALNDFNAEIPWGENDSLGAHIKEIDEAISGDIDRLRQWVVRAVSEAIADPETSQISWKHFQETQPHQTQKERAAEERREALKMSEFPKDVKQGSDDCQSAGKDTQTKDPLTGEACAKPGFPRRPGDQRPSRKPLIPPAMAS